MWRSPSDPAVHPSAPSTPSHSTLPPEGLSMADEMDNLQAAHGHHRQALHACSCFCLRHEHAGIRVLQK